MLYGVAVAVVATMASVATLHTFAPTSTPSATSSGSNLGRLGEPDHVKISAIRVGDTPQPLETKRPPVPILLTHRAADTSSDRASQPVVPRDNGATSANVTDENSVRAAIERDGYKSVRALRRGPEGMWNGRALRGKTDVAVTVDAAGNVSAN